jgi:hypothetical protein
VDALPDWLIALPDAETMRAIDRWAIEQQGVPGLDLMERAGASVTRAVEVHCADGPVVVVCGKGNNGGDGLVSARQRRWRTSPATLARTCAGCPVMRRCRSPTGCARSPARRCS